MGYRGRGSEASSHPTRVIRRTDLRSRGGGGQQRYQTHQPPRFSSLQDQDWCDAGEAKEKEADRRIRGEGKLERSENGDARRRTMEGKEDLSSDEGEWKEVKNGKKNSPKYQWKGQTGQTKKTPESRDFYDKGMARGQIVELSSDDGEWTQVKKNKRNSPKQDGIRNSTVRNKSTPGFKSQRKMEKETHDKVRRSPTNQEHRRDNNNTHQSSTRKSKSPKNSPENSRRRSNMSNEEYRGVENVGEHSNEKLSPVNKSPVSVTNKTPSPTNLMDINVHFPHMIMVSDLPDEIILRTQCLLEPEPTIEEPEEKIQLQGDILSYLRESWKEISYKLKDSQHISQPKIVYFKVENYNR